MTTIEKRIENFKTEFSDLDKKYSAYICVDNKQIFLGTSSNSIECAKAYDKYIIGAYGLEMNTFYTTPVPLKTYLTFFY